MSADDWKRELGGAVPPPRPEHRDRLEADLLERFDAKHARHRPHARWLRFAAPAAVLFSLAAASRVPAEYQVEVGKRLTFHLPPEMEFPSDCGPRVEALFQDERAHVLEMQVRLLRGEDGVQARIDVWGDRLASEEIIRRRIAALPELRGVQVEIAPLSGRVRDNLLDALGHRLFDVGTSQQEREAARQRLIRELREEAGEDATVDVEVEEGGRVRVRVKKQIGP
jgi:hypothetical protein